MKKKGEILYCISDLNLLKLKYAYNVKYIKTLGAWREWFEIGKTY
jgi:hypothetical protein